MLIIAGTVPVKDMPLAVGQAAFSGGDFSVGRQNVACVQGTGAMISAALQTMKYLGLEAPQAVLAGDIGKGEGSRAVYEYLIENIAALAPDVLALHYWLPDIALTKRLIGAVDKCEKRPLLMADAASMYSAKAAGVAPEFDIFIPDAAEAAFLADPKAPHPAYVRFMDYNADKMPEIIRRAYQKDNAAKFMLVKGSTDYIVQDGEILETVREPDVPFMEPIGGTGDTITGMVAAFLAAGLEPHEALIIAAKANRTAGQMAQVTPASRIGAVIEKLPEVFKKYLCQWSGVCTL